MRFQISIITTILLFTMLFAGCGGAETPTNVNQTNTTANNNSTANANLVKNTNNPLATTKKPEEATTNNAPTFTPLITAYNEAMKKKDEATVRKLYSRDTLKSFEADMKDEGKKSLVEFIAELDQVAENPYQIRNEKINGDTATVELKGGSLGVWTPIQFIKENGEWKITNKSSDFDDVKNAANNSAK